MINRSRHLVKRMVDNIMMTSEKFNRGICKQYDIIVKNITKQSEKTDELVAQMKYVENLHTGELLKLKVCSMVFCAFGETNWKNIIQSSYQAFITQYFVLTVALLN